MRKLTPKSLMLLVLLSITSGCYSSNWKQSMGSSEQVFSKTANDQLVISVPLVKMFENKHVRKLAQNAGVGNVEAIDRLVKQGVNINSRGYKGATPLFWALRNSSFSGFKKLLELGANPNLILADSSVLHWAARNKDIRFLQLALEFNGNPNLYAGIPAKTPIFNTIGVEGGDNLPALKLLLQAGADINARTGTEKVFGMSMGGVTPILAAADIVRFDIVYTLLKSGAKYHFKDDTGRDLMSRIKAVENRFTKGARQKVFLNKVINFLSKNETHR